MALVNPKYLLTCFLLVCSFVICAQKQGTISVKKRSEGVCFGSMGGTSWQFRTTGSSKEHIITLKKNGEIDVAQTGFDKPIASGANNYWDVNGSAVMLHIFGLDFTGKCEKPDLLKGVFSHEKKLKSKADRKGSFTTERKEAEWSATLIKGDWMRE